MHELAILPLTEEAFAPFGTVVEYRTEESRRGLVEELQNLRPEARPHLDLATFRGRHLPLVATVMERHRYSSQSLVPIDVARYLVLVAPHARSGGPDMAEAQLFAATGRQSITIRADTWHHPLTPLERSGVFAVLTFRARDAGDDEFVTLPEPVRLRADGA